MELTMDILSAEASLRFSRVALAVSSAAADAARANRAKSERQLSVERRRAGYFITGLFLIRVKAGRGRIVLGPHRFSALPATDGCGRRDRPGRRRCHRPR